LTGALRLPPESGSSGPLSALTPFSDARVSIEVGTTLNSDLRPILHNQMADQILSCSLAVHSAIQRE